jgi:hypothetical protein
VLQHVRLLHGVDVDLLLEKTAASIGTTRAVGKALMAMNERPPQRQRRFHAAGARSLGPPRPGITVARAWGSAGTDPGEFESPCGVCVLGDGRIIVSDLSRLQVALLPPPFPLRDLLRQGAGARRTILTHRLCLRT